MKTRLSALLIVASLMTCLVMNNPAKVRAQGVELGDGVSINAEVVYIDYVDREVGLLGPDGNIVDLDVGPQARNFNQIRVGDEVKATYYESVALFIGKKGEKPDASVGMTAARSAKGDMPAGTMVETVDVSAHIMAIDRTKRTVSLQLPDGKTVTKKVDPAVKAFDTLSKGDSVHVRYTEALAISVERP